MTLCLDSARIGVDRRLEDGVDETSCLDLVEFDLYGRVEPRRMFFGQATYLVGIWEALWWRLETGLDPICEGLPF